MIFQPVESVYTVSEINAYLKNLIDSDDQMRNVTVQGEVSNFTNHLKTGHFYFTIKDEACSLKAVMFRTYAQRVRFQVENGMRVLLTGSVRVFERDGAVQFYCEKIEPDGIGALALAFEQLKRKLDREGLFSAEHKQAIPLYPNRIGVITAKTGAALQDILNILSRRYPAVTAVLIPALMQGERAPESVCDAIDTAQAEGNLDILIIARGGGSVEDLWCFNDERIARAIYDCKIPVISAIGHEIDFTIADFAADLRAPTPSAAAELCVPDVRELCRKLEYFEELMYQNVLSLYRKEEKRVGLAKQRLENCSPQKMLRGESERLTELKQRLFRAENYLLEKKMQQYIKQVSMLEALSPLKVLARGYSVALADGQTVSSVSQVQPGDNLQTRVSDGFIESTVTGITEKKGLN